VADAKDGAQGLARVAPQLIGLLSSSVTFCSPLFVASKLL
jgi:hypothetical protein